MSSYIIKKFLQMIPMLLLISVLVFLGIQMMPIDPIHAMFPPDVLADTNKIDALREKMGLDDPLHIQYINWIREILSGNLGFSIVSGMPITDIITRYVPSTLQLTLAAFIISAIIGVSAGVFAARRPNGLWDNLSRILIVFGDSVPQVLVGMILIYFFSLKLGWLPASGRLSYGENPFWSSMKSLILPAFALSLGMISTVLRYTRNSLLGVMNEDYIKTARSKGISEGKVYFKHGFRNALGPVLVTLLFRVPSLIGGAVVVEKVFSWPGMGSVIMGAVSTGDYPVLLITTLLVAVLMLVVSFVLDLLSAILDPRVRMES